MSLHVHHLRGCIPSVLAHYLKALGVLRIVATQTDPEARGYWRDEGFHLVTSLDRAALLDFLATRYAPTPLVAPWNGGSGFYPKDSQVGIGAIRAASARRLVPYQQAIAQAALAVVGREVSPKEDEKQALLGECRRTWRGPVLAWLDAAVVIGEELVPSYPSLLGTGGNDGRLDFTNNFMQRLGDLWDLTAAEAPATPAAIHLLASALFADQPTPGLSTGAAIGQFLPGGAGGANSTTGFDGKSLINPWDFVLMLEGSICFAAALSRRLRDGESAQLAAPFSIRSMAVGFGTAAPSEESARGEQWLPLWSQPATFEDLGALLAEGRCQQGRSPVRRPVEMARALARHGAARGIDAFQRFAFLERNGQANLAIPLGRWPVSIKPHPHQSLADEAAEWIERLEQKARGDQAPASWRRAARICSEALLAVSRDPQDARWKNLFISLGAAERVLATTHAQARDVGLRPLPRLSPGWVDKVGTTPAMRIALAIADQASAQRNGVPDASDTVRHHWMALDGHQPDYLRFAERAGTDVLSDSADPLDWLANLVRRRSVRESPLVSHHGHTAGLHDLALFLGGDPSADSGAVFDLLGPCLALDRQSLTPMDPPVPTAAAVGGLATYGLLRLATMADGVELAGVRVRVPCDHRVILTLCAGAVDRAVDLAARRLRHARLRPFLDRTVGGMVQARTLAAALAIPLNRRDATRLALRLTKPSVADPATTTI
jgi:CRISPR-associated protein Csx17